MNIALHNLKAETLRLIQAKRILLDDLATKIAVARGQWDELHSILASCEKELEEEKKRLEKGIVSVSGHTSD